AAATPPRRDMGSNDSGGIDVFPFNPACPTLSMGKKPLFVFACFFWRKDSGPCLTTECGGGLHLLFTGFKFHLLPQRHYR
ncbi:hypothetical protein, partial [uncultured Bilophila sp.]